MWWLALLLVGRALDGAGAGRPAPWDDDDDDLYGYSHLSVVNSTQSVTQTEESQLTRARSNNQTTLPARTLSQDERRGVRDILNKMLLGADLSAFTQETVTDLQRLIDIMSSPTPDLMADLARFTPRSTGKVKRERGDKINVSREGRSRSDANWTIETYNGVTFKRTDRYNNHVNISFRLLQEFEWHNLYEENIVYLEKICLRKCADETKCVSLAVDIERDEDGTKTILSVTCKLYYMPEEPELEFGNRDVPGVYYVRIEPPRTTTAETDTTSTTTEYGEESTAVTQPKVEPLMIYDPRTLDIKTLVAIIANLTMNTIESNLTELFNATLQKYGIPMCAETTTTEEPTYDFANATIISKCFVCGLDAPGIPRDAYCADAFSGDFLPLVPVDPRARGQIAKYRKYCRYLDVPGTLTNETQPRSVFGRWTGGCSVRWIDLSGVYTQRACRNRHHAVMGNHFVSKRMAKLEMALKNEDNGCIISPMASLVPLSRGISLYARFHACVCTGNWCNGAPPARSPVRPRHACLTALAATAAVVLLA